jgi:putative transposase
MTTIQTRKGAKIQYGGETMRVVGQKGFDTLTLQSADGQYFHAPLKDLVQEAEGQASKTLRVDPIRLSKVEAYKHAFANAGLLGTERRTSAKIEAVAKSLGIGRSTVYNALARYDLSGNIDDLPPPTRPGGRGKSRLNPKAEKIIQDAIEELLLTRRQHQPKLFLEDVERRLAKAGFQVSVSTLRDRLAKIPEHKWKARRQGYDAAKAEEAHRGFAPTGTRPLETVQIDHWKMDIEILSEDRQTVIGRVWLTLAIDLYTRVIWGWHLSLEVPSFASLGYCMVRGMTQKNSYLESLGLQLEMPFWGCPEELHLDNAGEFRGNSLGAACDHFHIKLKFRPVKSPQYGCHIERLNGTLARKFRDLPGATGSKPGDRKQLRPEATATFTFRDLEMQVAMLINEYHRNSHLGIGGKTPLELWSNYYFGPSGPKHPTPLLYVDDLTLRLEWYPLKHPSPTIQSYGIRVDYLDYYGEPIEFLVKNHKKEAVTVKTDPLDVTHIYVLHPIQGWVEVPCRYLSFPLASIWELKAAKKEAARLKRQPTPEALARLIEDRRQHQAEAEKLTKTAQREAAKRTRNEEMRQQRKAEPAFPEDGEIALINVPAEPKPKRPHQPTKRGSVDATSLDLAIAETAELSDADIDAYLEEF